MHIPVLAKQVLEVLNPQPGQTYLDCTAGLGGHAADVGARLGAGGNVVLFDLDPGNLAAAGGRVRGVENPPTVHTVHASFVQAPRKMRELGLKADMVLADLGFASNQIADPKRGFSFMEKMEGPLDMRLDPTSPITAAELVNTLPERELANLIRDVGEEPQPVARRIAANVVSARAAKPIQTTRELATIVRAALPAARVYAGGIDAATKTFQALRIAVNDELGNLTGLLSAIERAAAAIGKGEPSWLNRGARIAIISFHSLEDRPVKQTFNRLVEYHHAEQITKKPITADETELAANPRARSAKLRAIRLAS